MCQSIIGPEDTVVTERPGGGVQFKSGKIQRYRISEQGMPRVGRRYVLFLQKGDQESDFYILTGYELRAGRVIPLDGFDSKEGNKFQFAVYEGVDENAFLTTVREAVTNATQAIPGKGGQSQ